MSAGHRVRRVEISYDQDSDTHVDEDALIALIEEFMCGKHPINKHILEDDCPMIAISCQTETVLCSNCNTDRPC